MVNEGGSSFTTPDTTLSCNPSSVDLEGESSYVHLDDYIEWNPPRVIPRGFPLDVWTHGYLDFTCDLFERQAGPKSTRDYGGGWLFSGITQEGVIAPDLSRQPSLLLIMH